MIPNPPPISYEQALDLVAHARTRKIAPYGQLQVNSLIDTTIQAKLITANTAMMSVGRLFGDFPVNKFESAITYHYLRQESLTWLENCGVHVNRQFAPLAVDNYVRLFGTEETLPVKKGDLNLFFEFFIHCMLIEAQIILAKQYYHGLGLYQKDAADSILSPDLPDKFPTSDLSNKLGEIEYDQFHGRIFLEYCAIMIRAQWDKLIRLQGLVFELKHNWDKISKGIKLVKAHLDKEKGLHPWSKYHSELFIRIAEERVSEDGWLKHFRDPLLHNIGQHSSGVLPRKNSLETTSQMWDKVCDEHNALREGILCLLASFISKNTKVNAE